MHSPGSTATWYTSQSQRIQPKHCMLHSGAERNANKIKIGPVLVIHRRIHKNYRLRGGPLSPRGRHGVRHHGRLGALQPIVLCQPFAIDAPLEHFLHAGGDPGGRAGDPRRTRVRLPRGRGSSSRLGSSHLPPRGAESAVCFHHRPLIRRSPDGLCSKRGDGARGTARHIKQTRRVEHTK